MPGRPAKAPPAPNDWEDHTSYENDYFSPPPMSPQAPPAPIYPVYLKNSPQSASGGECPAVVGEVKGIKEEMPTFRA